MSLSSVACQDDFTAVIENSDRKELKLYVYNTKTERVREVSVYSFLALA